MTVGKRPRALDAFDDDDATSKMHGDAWQATQTVAASANDRIKIFPSFFGHHENTEGRFWCVR